MGSTLNLQWPFFVLNILKTNPHDVVHEKDHVYPKKVHVPPSKNWFLVQNIVLPLIIGHLCVTINLLSITNLTVACPIGHTNPSRPFILRVIRVTEERGLRPGFMAAEKKNRLSRLIWICTIESKILVKVEKYSF